MIYLSYSNINNNIINDFYNTWNQVHNALFSPDNLQECIIDTHAAPKGKTYKEKQKNLRDAAWYFQFNNPPCYYWSEYAEITTYFEKYGKKYGLLTEFKTNGII